MPRAKHPRKDKPAWKLTSERMAGNPPKRHRIEKWIHAAMSNRRLGAMPPKDV